MIVRTREIIVASLATMAVVAGTITVRATEYPNGHLLISAEALAEPAPNEQPRVIVDVRPAESFAEGHIPGALQLDPNAVVETAAPVDGELRSVDEITAMIGAMGIDAETEIVLYDDKAGFHAARMFWVLEYLGHRKVRMLNGGLAAWTAAGGALAAGDAARPTPRRFAPALSPRRFASADWIMERRDDAAVRVIDVRPEKLFAKGHIPWAISIPWKRNLAEDGMMRPAGELRAMYEAEGIRWDDDVVVHCQNGLASSHSYVALRVLGHPSVRTYHRSWAEWGTSDDLPKSKPSAG